MGRTVDQFDKNALRAVIDGIPKGRKRFCELTGISSSSLTNYLSGKTRPTYENLYLISELFGIPTWKFIGKASEVEYENIAKETRENATKLIRTEYEANLERKGIQVDELSSIDLEKEKVEAPYPYNLIDAIFRKHVDFLLSKDTEDGLNYALSTLTDREQLILQKRFFDCKTLLEVSDIIGTSRERVRSIEAKALRKLRHPSRMKYYRLGITGIEKYNSLKELEREINEKNAEYVAIDRKIRKLRKELEELNAEIRTAENGIDTGELDFDQLSIEELKFSTRTHNCLTRKDIKTVGTLIEWAKDEESLLRIRNLGVKSLDEIYTKLSEMYGIDPREECGLENDTDL